MFTKIMIKTLVVGALVFGATLTQCADAAVLAGICGTGVAQSGSGLAADGATDAHYTLNGGAVYVSDQSKYPIVGGGPWIPDTSTSKWISPSIDPSVGYPVTTFDYQTKFDLSNVSLSSVVINGAFAADDSTAIYVNGKLVHSQYGGFTSFTNFLLNSANSAFLAGTNTIDFVVYNSGGGPTGLQVKMSGTGDINAPALNTPEPNAMAMLCGMGATGFAFLRRRKARLS